MLEALEALKMKFQGHMVKVGKSALLHKKWTFRVELTKKKTSHCKSRDFLRKRRLKIAKGIQNFKVLPSTVSEKPKSWTELAR